jgi:hypothetical protein
MVLKNLPYEFIDLPQNLLRIIDLHNLANSKNTSGARP